VVALRFEAEDVLHALVGDLGLIRDAKQVHDHARGVEPHGLKHGLVNYPREERARELRAIDVGDIGAED
jgi:hypothetical protein